MERISDFVQQIRVHKGFFGVKRYIGKNEEEFRLSAANFLRDVKKYALIRAVELEGMDNGMYVTRYNILKRKILEHILYDCVNNYYSSTFRFDVTRNSLLGKKIVEREVYYDN